MTFSEIIKEAKPGFEDYKSDNDLKKAYYNVADGMNELEEALSGDYKNILAEFMKVKKAFDNFDKKVGLGKNL